MNNIGAKAGESTVTIFLILHVLSSFEMHSALSKFFSIICLHKYIASHAVEFDTGDK